MILFSDDAVQDIERLRSFLDAKSPPAAGRALSAIFSAIERLREFPELGAPTADAEIRQLAIRFGSSAYIVRYAILASHDILITRVWHGREERE